MHGPGGPLQLLTQSMKSMHAGLFRHSSQTTVQGPSKAHCTQLSHEPEKSQVGGGGCVVVVLVVHVVLLVVHVVLLVVPVGVPPVPLELGGAPP